MTLIRTGQGITDIRGGFSGVYFHRDKSGLHCSTKPRNIYRRSAAQNKQRNCFGKARTYSKDERTVSYLIYRCLNDLPFIFDAIVTGNPDPDCTGTYELAGTYNDKDYYKRKDAVWFLWWNSTVDRWIISDLLGGWTTYLWNHDYTIEGVYEPKFGVAGNPIVKLEIHPPPPDYQIPKL